MYFNHKKTYRLGQVLQFLQWVAAICIFVSAPLAQSQADESASQVTSQSKWDFTSSRIGAIGVIQGGGWSTSGTARYTPSYEVAQSWRVGLDLGYTYLKRSDSSKFSAFDYLAFVSYRVSEPWEIRLQLGAETWTCSDCQTKLAVGPSVSYQLPHPPMSWFKEIWFTYLPVFESTVAHELSIGAGLHF